MELRKRKKVDYTKELVQTAPESNQTSVSSTSTVSSITTNSVNSTLAAPTTTTMTTNSTNNNDNSNVGTHSAVHASSKKNKITAASKKQNLAQNSVPPQNNDITNIDQASHNVNNKVYTRNQSKTESKPHINTGLNKIVVNVLERPSMKTNFNLQETAESIDTMELYSKNLERLIDLQYELYYKDLKKPELLGPKNFESLKLPNDLVTLRNIQYGWTKLVEDLKKIEMNKVDIDNHTSVMDNNFNNSEYLSNCDLTTLNSLLILNNKLKTENVNGTYYNSNTVNNNGIKNDDNSLINAISKIHNINCDNLKDLKSKTLTPDGKVNFDPNFIDPNEIKIISKKIDKPLLREKNNNLNWPNKIKKKKIRGKSAQSMDIDNPTLRFRDVPLFH